MGLNHPRDLDAWRQWQASHQSPLRKVRRRLSRPSDQVAPTLTTTGDHPTVLVALDSLSPTSRLSLLRPAGHLPAGSVAFLAPAGATVPVDGASPARAVDLDHDASLADVRAVVALGSYMEVGGLAHAFARERGLPFLVVQHGLVTPWAPPLPDDAHLLAWSTDDGDFWRSGRDDVSVEVIGSQLLWEAAGSPAEPPSGGRPLYLGQLHSAELGRRSAARAAVAFCRAEDAVYRPHPSETDLVSRVQHAVWQRRGIAFDTAGTPLVENRQPVVSVFSTGVLEAAARGVPSWVAHPDPPAWVREFWERYDLRPWGGDPTPAPAPATQEPAAAVATTISRLTGGTP